MNGAIEQHANGGVHAQSGAHRLPRQPAVSGSGPLPDAPGG